MPEREAEIAELVKTALELEPASWPHFLNSSCPAELRDEVDSLLSYQSEAARLIETPAAQLASRLIAEASTLIAGEHIQQYEIESLIGIGGMGEVYLAVDTQLKRKVALKLVQRGLQTQNALRRFRQEEQILAGLNHPNIAQLYGSGLTDDGTPFFAMEYVEGIRIDEFCNQQQLSIPERLRLFSKVCSAVSYAHQRLIIHRDLKPANIRVTPAGEPKLLDFGIAKLLDPEATTIEPTITVERVMTPEYASPEQVRGESMTTASDVYSLGVILYELLTGEKPYRLKTRTAEEISRAIMDKPPTRPSIAAPANRRVLAGDLDNIVLAAMRKEPERRYATVAAFAADLERHLDGRPVQARKDSVSYRTGKFMGRNKLAVAAAVVIGLSIIVALIVSLVQTQIARRQRDLAEQQRRKAEKINSFMNRMLSFSNQSITSVSPVAHRKDVTVNQMLDEVEPQIENELRDEPAIRAQLLYTIGSAYASQGRYDAAEKNFRSALDIENKLEGEDALTAAAIMLDLGVLNYRQARFADAEEVLLKALHVYERQDANYDPAKHALALDYYAVVRFWRNAPDEAAAVSAQALAIVQRATGKIDRRVDAFIKADRGGMLFFNGLTDEGERLLKEATAEYRQISTVPQWEEGAALMGLANIALSRNDLAEGQRCVDEADKILVATLGQTNNFYLSDLRQMQAFLALRLNDLPQAEARARDAVKLRSDLRAQYPRGWGDALNTLSWVLRQTGALAEAEDCARQALASYEKQPSPIAWVVPNLWANISQILAAQHRFAEAEEAALKGYEIAHKSTAKASGKKYTADNLRQLYEMEGKHEEAARLQ